MGFNSKKFLSFELSGDSLRIAQFERVINTFVLIDTFDMSFNNIENIDWQAVRERYKKQQVVLSVTDRNVMQKNVFLDLRLSNKQIWQVLQKSAPTHFAHTYAELYLDYQTINALKQDNKQCLRVTAMTRAFIAPFLFAAKKAGFSIKTIDVSSYCAARCCARLGHQSTLLALFAKDIFTLMHIKQQQVVFLKSSTDVSLASLVKLMQYLKTHAHSVTASEVYCCGERANAFLDDFAKLCDKIPTLLTPAAINIKTDAHIAANSSWTSICGLALRDQHD